MHCLGFTFTSRSACGMNWWHLAVVHPRFVGDPAGQSCPPDDGPRKTCLVR